MDKLITKLLANLTKISEPLTVVGLCATLLFFAINKILSNKKLFPSLTKKAAFELLKYIIDKLFYLSALSMALGYFLLSQPTLINEDSTMKAYNKQMQSNAYSKSPQTSSVTPYSEPTYRLTYFNLSGLAIEYLLNGKVDKMWEKRLGGQPYIVENVVSKELRSLIESYNCKSDCDMLSLNIETEDSSYTQEHKDISINTFIGADNGITDTMLFSDLRYNELVKRLCRSFEANPSDWSMQLSPITQDHERIVNGQIDINFTGLRKCLNKNDFDTFFPRDYNPSCSRTARDFYDYICRNGVPQGFLFMSVFYGGCDDGVGLTYILHPRYLQLHVVVIENISNTSFEIGKINLKINPSLSLRSRSSEEMMLNQVDPEDAILFPPRVLAAGERLVIPLAMVFRNDSESFGKAKLQTNALSINESNSIARNEYISFVAGLGFRSPKKLFAMKKKAFESILSNPRPDENKEEFIYGPSARLYSIELNHTTTQVRQYDPKQFVIRNGFHEGSCPYLYVHSKKSNRWINSGHILYGFKSKNLEYTDIKLIDDDIDNIIISEQELETTYIDYINMLLKCTDNSTYVIRPNNDLLDNDDGRYLSLANGESINLNFDRGTRYYNNCDHYLMIKGYYIPQNK